MAIGAFDGDRLVGSVYGFATAPAARAALALPGGRSRLPAHRARRRAEAPTTRVVPGQRAHGDALDVRPVAARQRPPQPAVAAGDRRCSTTPTSTDRWVASTEVCRATGWSSSGTWSVDGSQAPSRRRSRSRPSRPTRSPARPAAALHARIGAARCDVPAVRRRLDGDRRRSRRSHVHAQPLTSCVRGSIDVDHGIGELREHLADLGRQPVAVGAVEVAEVGPIPSPVGIGGRNPTVVVEIDRSRSPHPIPGRGRTAASTDRPPSCCEPDAESTGSGRR